MPRLIFINRFYWPDETATAQLLTDLAEEFAARGHEVRVIASRPPGEAPSERRGVRILRVGPDRSQAHGMAGKGLDFAKFFAAGIRALWRETGPGDTIVALTDPPLIGVGAALVAGLRRARVSHWIQDIYPEVAAEITGRRLWNLFRPVRNWGWRRALACVTLGEDMGRALAAAGVPASRRHLQPNWAPRGVQPPAPADVAAVRSGWDSAGKFAVVYSGNLGRVHELDCLIELATVLDADPAVAVIFAGGGPLRLRLEAAAARRGLRNVRFLPPTPRADLSAGLGAADIHLVTLRPGCERWVFPSKLYGIAAAGRPVLFLGPPDAEIARLIRQHGLGWVFSPGTVADAAVAVRRLRRAPLEVGAAADRARRFAQAGPGPADAAAAWERWLELPARIDPAPDGAKSAAVPAS